MKRSIHVKIFRFIAFCYGKRLKKIPNLVLFGAMNGKHYGDNSRHLYEWILRNNPELSPVWITKNIAVYNDLKSKKKPVALSTSIVGFLLLFKAKVAAYTNSLADLCIYPALLPTSLKLVLLPHGSAAKGVRYARLTKLSKKVHILRQKESSHIAYIISLSKFDVELNKKIYRLEHDKHVITGYPRNDSLFNISYDDIVNWQHFLDGRKPRFTILYGPTWRHGRCPTHFFPFEDLDIDRLLLFLDKTKTLFLLRPHIQDLSSPETTNLLRKLANMSEMIMLASHDTFPDSHLLMRFADALISDYSGLIHDYLLLDRPIVLVPYDYEDYAQQNGFLYDYFERLPGKSISSFSEFVIHLEELINGGDPYQSKRHALCDKIHLYKDCHSCRRVNALIQKLLKSNADER